MKKIGIITIVDYFNYGNRLQNYAVQEVLKMFEYQTDTLVIQPPVKEKNISYYIKRIFQLGPKKLIGIFMTKVGNKREKPLIEGRIKALMNFTKMNITEKQCSTEVVRELSNYYDLFVVGSDQIWNPNFRKGLETDFLTFAPKSKRIAYAPSFGIAEISDKYIDRYKTWLSEMAHLSVREDAGANIIKKLTGREARVLMDPTLMISKSQWISISKPSKLKPSKKYLLTYFLGSIPKEQFDTIKMIADRYKLEIVHLGNLLDEERYSSELEEFLDYFHSADIIMTNSFHGTIFSILFEKPFIVFDKTNKTPSMFSRIETLLSTFNFQDRKWKSFNLNNDVYNINFSNTSNILNLERKKTLDYLAEALKYDKVKDETGI